MQAQWWYAAPKDHRANPPMHLLCGVTLRCFGNRRIAPSMELPALPRVRAVWHQPQSFRN
jgi:hypothetical protein